VGSTLDDLFDSYEKRKQAEERVAREKESRMQREREEALAVLRKKVIPPLKRIIEQIRGRGHVANLVERLDDAEPTLVLEFTPARRSETPPFPEASTITFVFHNAGWIETTQDVSLAASRGVTERWKLNDITEQWATRQVLHLVEAALKQH
jgi:hypothetical protein